jgi:hypothetical protein
VVARPVAQGAHVPRNGRDAVAHALTGLVRGAIPPETT